MSVCTGFNRPFIIVCSIKKILYQYVKTLQGLTWNCWTRFLSCERFIWRSCRTRCPRRRWRPGWQWWARCSLGCYRGHANNKKNRNNPIHHMSFIRLKCDCGLTERGYLRIFAGLKLYLKKVTSNSLKTLNLWPWKQTNSWKKHFTM